MNIIPLVFGALWLAVAVVLIIIGSVEYSTPTSSTSGDWLTTDNHAISEIVVGSVSAAVTVAYFLYEFFWRKDGDKAKAN